MADKPSPDLLVDARSPCPNQAAHTPLPSGYTDWHEAAEELARTHDQLRCPFCGLFAIWELRPTEQVA